VAREQLPVDACLKLPASVPVGRICFTRQALPAIELVEFVTEGGDVIVAADHDDPLGAKLAAGQVVAFQADDVDYRTGDGWTVSLVGRAREMTEVSELARLATIGGSAAIGGRPACLIRTSPATVTGWHVARAS
jgi:uncharacterized protein